MLKSLALTALSGLERLTAVMRCGYERSDKRTVFALALLLSIR